MDRFDCHEDAVSWERRSSPVQLMCERYCYRCDGQSSRKSVCSDEWPMILIDLYTREGVVGRSYLEPGL